MITRNDLITTGLNIETRNVLDFIIFKTRNATKPYQRRLKNLEKDFLLEIENKLEIIKEEDSENVDGIENLKEEQSHP